MSRVVDQNSLTPKGEQNSQTRLGSNKLNFRLARDLVVRLKPRQSCEPVGVKETIFSHFFFSILSFEVQQKT